MRRQSCRISQRRVSCLYDMDHDFELNPKAGGVQPPATAGESLHAFSARSTNLGLRSWLAAPPCPQCMLQARHDRRPISSIH